MNSSITIGGVVIPVTSATFTCEECGGTFPREWSDEKAREEAKANGFDPDGVDIAIVCDDCYKKLMDKPTELT
jgi:Fe2+ or Zn2+ uptake regulation protein